MASASPQTLLSLPNETLHDILAYILAEYNCKTRPAVLRTCSLLLGIGRPLLHRHVRVASFEQWRCMFGEGGWLVSEEEGGKGYGKWVKELELNRSKTIKFEWNFPIPPSFSLSALQTLTLSHRLVESWVIDPSRPLDFDVGYKAFSPNSRKVSRELLTAIFASVPSFTTLRLLASPTPPTAPHPPSSGLWSRHSRPPLLSNLTSGVLPSFKHLVMQGDLVLDDPRPEENDLLRSVAFASFPGVETLVVEITKDQSSLRHVESWYMSLMRGSLERERETRWKDLKKIELRLGKKATLFESRFRKASEKSGKVGRSSCEERMVPLVVFVRRDATERRLEEWE